MEKEFTLPLDYTIPHLIDHLVQEGEPWGYRDSRITDTEFPVKGSGIVPVRFRIVSGNELKSASYWAYRSDVEAKFRTLGLRLPNAAEALLILAKDHQVGRRRPLVAFVQDSRRAFVVFVVGRKRELHLDDGGASSSRCILVGIYE